MFLTESDPRATPRVPADRFALWVVRRACAASATCGRAEFEAMAAAFREALPGAPGDRGASRDERRLLRAAAAMQAGDPALADNFLFKLALERTARVRLTAAVVTLARFVAARGHRLPPLPAALPAAALPVALLHGRDLGVMPVAWPVFVSP